MLILRANSCLYGNNPYTVGSRHVTLSDSPRLPMPMLVDMTLLCGASTVDSLLRRVGSHCLKPHTSIQLIIVQAPRKILHSNKLYHASHPDHKV